MTPSKRNKYLDAMGLTEPHHDELAERPEAPEIAATSDAGLVSAESAALPAPHASSWFAQRYPHQEVEKLVSQYRQQRHLESAHEGQGAEAYTLYRRHMAEQQMLAAPRRPGEESFSLLPERRARDWRAEEHEYFSEPALAEEKKAPWAGLIYASLGFLLMGGGLALGLVNWNKLHVPAPLASSTAPQVIVADTASASVLPLRLAAEPALPFRKTVATAGLKVADAQGALDQPIPLDLRLEPASEAHVLSLKLSGLPQNASLNKGKRLSEHEWELRPGETADLTLLVHETSAPQLQLTVAARDASGRLAAPTREFTVSLDGVETADAASPAEEPQSPQEAALADADRSPGMATATMTQPHDLASAVTVAPAAAAIPETVAIVPVNGPPEATATPAVAAAEPAAHSSANAGALGLIEKGNVLFQAGDLTSARQFYMRAYELGDQTAAVHVAETYDPIIYQKLGVHGLVADQAQAEIWYQKAKVAPSP